MDKVQRPGRYCGGEWNEIVKDPKKVSVKFGFAFPDAYEIGMSYLGLQILYSIINSMEGVSCERVFAPWVDMEQAMRKEGVPLFSLENRLPLRCFDIVGFTLQYEMTYTNLLNMLELAEIPLHSSDRSEGHPLVIVGGPCAFNPEPLAPFIDAVFLGEAEEAIAEIIQVVKDWKGHGARSRPELLLELSKVPGVYVPQFYEVEYNADGTVKSIWPNREGVPPRVTKRVVKELDAAAFPVRQLVPQIETVHDRATVEVFRGCTRGCRFCQAGMVYRPVRERSLDLLKRLAREAVESTGYEEVALTSLSSSDYSRIAELVESLSPDLARERVGISLPSLRADAFSVGLARQIQRVRKSGLTFAPEAGTQRLRDVINKNVTEEDLLDAVKGAFESGWDRVKLYFMIGLPTETYDDLQGIVDLTNKVVKVYHETRGSRNPVIGVSASSFVPKPHTPFQWEPQLAMAELMKRQVFLRQNLNRRGIEFKWHDVHQSYYEAAFTRGDRRLARALELAWAKGCRFDAWTDQFKPSVWEESLSESGLDAGFYANRHRPAEETLPWDHLDTGVSKKFLLKEMSKALNAEPTPDCRRGPCPGCEACQRTDSAVNLKGE